MNYSFMKVKLTFLNQTKSSFLCELRGKDNVREQIYYSVYYPSNIFHKTRVLLKIGEYHSDLSQL